MAGNHALKPSYELRYALGADLCWWHGLALPGRMWCGCRRRRAHLAPGQRCWRALMLTCRHSLLLPRMWVRPGPRRRCGSVRTKLRWLLVWLWSEGVSMPLYRGPSLGRAHGDLRMLSPPRGRVRRWVGSGSGMGCESLLLRARLLWRGDGQRWVPGSMSSLSWWGRW